MDFRPHLQQLREVKDQLDEEQLDRRIGDACIESYSINAPFIEQKANTVGRALWCLAAEAGFLTLAVLAPFF